MSWHGYNITWSKEFKDFAFYSTINTNMAEHASEWLFQSYASHESITAFETDYNHATITELEAYSKEVLALINKSKELKMIRKWFKHVHEQTGYDYMKDLRKAMHNNYEMVIE
tara:strand:- start:1018 stop:1356 length:339 start_codon:yes stop_codon:yes gene_type:complete